MLGFSYSLYSNALMPAISLIVSKSVIGTAFGVLQMMESVALATLPIFSGLIV